MLSLGSIFIKRGIHFRHSKFPDFLHYLNSLKTSTSKEGNRLYQILGEDIHILTSGVNEINELEKLGQDEKDLEKAVLEEIKELEPQVDAAANRLRNYLLKFRKSYDEDNAVLEVQAGAGGLEAGIFAEEVLQLYHSYASLHLHYQVELLELTKNSGATDNMGISKASISIKGINVFQRMKYESGVHRVQRVPLAGTKNDRLQTSTCSVAVLPLLRDFSRVKISQNELSCTYCRSSGPGGQGVNTTSSAVRMVHLPTNTVVNCQEQRTANANYSLALEKLKNKLYQSTFAKESNKICSSRKSQIGGMNRNEKIRTYNYPRNAITEHRIDNGVKNVTSLKEFMRGEQGFDILDLFYSSLKEADDEKELFNIINE